MIEITYKPKDIISEITRTLKIFKSDTTLKEIRTFGNKIYSGYFTVNESLTKAINEYKDITWYFVMNTIDSECYHREQRDRIVYSKTTTSDNDITNREWLLIDCDPIRKSGMSASDDEKQHTLNILSAVYDFLQSRGFYEPVIADSGNGYHLLYQIDTPNTKENTDTIKSFLSLLDTRYSDEYVKIDTAVFNPARITKLYGTYARKGANTADRPHRQSHIMNVPEQIDVTDISLIQSVADMLPKPERPTYNGKSDSKFDIHDFIHKHGIAVQPDRVCSDKTIIRLEKCPFNPEHKAPDSALFLYNDGALGFKCFHDSCSNNHWQDFRKHYEPEAYEKRSVTPVNHVTIGDDETPIDIESLSTWEEIIDENLLMSILMNNDHINSLKLVSLLNDKAKKLNKFREFNKIVEAYRRKVNRLKREQYNTEYPDGMQIDDLPSDLHIFMYTVNNDGVYDLENGYQIISQPLIITKQFEDIETGLMKVELTFKNQGQWKYHVCEREIIANKNKIVSLANIGLSVTNDNANNIVRYLQALQTENEIPTQKSVSHMGYVGEKFVPYTHDIVYTGEPAYKDTYEAVNSQGGYLKTWVDMYKTCRNDNIAVRASVASSFASPLLNLFKKLPFILHCWGASGAGKTVILRLVCSVWGYHENYMRNLNNTYVGAERLAYFYHNLPLALDELQTLRKSIDISDMVYMLAEGQGRTRGNVKGIDTILQWRCAIVTNGEEPLTSSNSKTGVFNRIIDVPITGQIFKNPSHVYAVCDENYGHAGRYFIEHIAEYKPREILAYWESVLNQRNSDISSKHQMSLSVILTADELVNRMLFDMNEVEARTDTMEFYMKLSTMMISTADSDLATRAYEFLVSWVVQNKPKFDSDDQEIWGKYSDGCNTVFIMRNALEKALTDNGFNYKAVLKALAERKYSVLSENLKNKEYTKTFKLNNTTVRGIELILPT